VAALADPAPVRTRFLAVDRSFGRLESMAIALRAEDSSLGFVIPSGSPEPAPGTLKETCHGGQ
jgi:hypothetical protein